MPPGGAAGGGQERPGHRRGPARGSAGADFALLSHLFLRSCCISCSFVCVWRFSSALAISFRQAHPSACTPALPGLQHHQRSMMHTQAAHRPGARNELGVPQVREAVTLSATISIHNPRGYRTWHCNTMEAGAAEADLPTRDFWHAIMVRCFGTGLLLISSDLSLHTFPHIPLYLPGATYGMPSWCSLGLWHRVLQGVGVFAGTIKHNHSIHCLHLLITTFLHCPAPRPVLHHVPPLVQTVGRHAHHCNIIDARCLGGQCKVSGLKSRPKLATLFTTFVITPHFLWRAEGSLKMPEMRAGKQQLQRLYCMAKVSRLPV